jgi:peptidoglycan hydrolase-like protein with peptidoglycan-binding domain
MSSSSSFTIMTDPGNGRIYYNVGRHLCLGTMGADVAMVQYLLARAPESIPYPFANGATLSNGDCPIGVGDVDGNWGPNTDAAMSWFEQASVLTPVYPDGAVDPMGSVPYGDQMNFINGGTAYEYKLALLQQMYVSVICRNAFPDPQTQNRAIRSMANDGECPSILSSDPLLTTEASIANQVTS